MFSSDTTAADLLQNGRAVFTFPKPIEALVGNVIEGFKKLLAESEEVRRSWCFDLGGRNDPDDGLVQKEGRTNPDNGDVYDRKSYLHYRKHLYKLLRGRRVKTEGYEKFLCDCADLHARCTSIFDQVMQSLDGNLPGLNLYDKAMAGGELHALRLLWYEKPLAEKDNVVAAAHVDRCTLTSQVAESRPGLYVKNQAGHWESYNALPNTGLIFPGAKAPNLTDRLPPLEHDVRDMLATGESRWSIVFFGHTDTPIAEQFEKTRRVPGVAEAQAMQVVSAA